MPDRKLVHSFGKLGVGAYIREKGRGDAPDTPLAIVCDTREQTPYRFESFPGVEITHR